MSKIITVIYGSSTGNTEHAAQAIAGKLGGRAVNIRNASAADFQADLLILGTSTWGCGELQDDWIAGKVVHWRHQNTANVTYVDGHVGQTTRAVWKQFRLSFQRSEIIK